MRHNKRPDDLAAESAKVMQKLAAFIGGGEPAPAVQAKPAADERKGLLSRIAAVLDTFPGAPIGSYRSAKEIIERQNNESRAPKNGPRM